MTTANGDVIVVERNLLVEGWLTSTTVNGSLYGVPSALPFYSGITWLVDRGITKPGADGNFGPAGSVSP